MVFTTRYISLSPLDLQGVTWIRPNAPRKCTAHAVIHNHVFTRLFEHHVKYHPLPGSHQVGGYAADRLRGVTARVDFAEDFPDHVK